MYHHIPTTNLNTSIRTLYRRTARHLPQICNTSKIDISRHSALQHIRSTWIDRYAQHNHDQRVADVLLHRADILLYDMISGNKTRHQIKQIVQPADLSSMSDSIKAAVERTSRTISETAQQVGKAVAAASTKSAML